MLAFVANPDRYGRFGHQSFSMLTAWALAVLLKERFIPLPYLYFAYHFNKFVDFSRSRYATLKIESNVQFFHLPGSQVQDVAGNNRLDLSTTSGLLHMIDQISQCQQNTRAETMVAFLPFDQDIGKLSRLIEREKDDLRRIFHLNGLFYQDQYNTNMLKIAIHIRRGDVTRQRHPDWYVPISVYSTIISILKSNYQDCQITIVSDGPPWSLDVLDLLKKFKNIQLRGPDSSEIYNGKILISSDIMDFACMASNDIVIGSKSTYSWLASRVGNCKFIPIVSEGQYMPHHLRHEGIIGFNHMTDEVTSFSIGPLDYLPQK